MVPLRRESYLEEYLPEERFAEREQAAEQSRPANKHVGIGRQIRLVLFVLSVATVCLALVGGYERLAAAHQSNMGLEDEIKEADIYIEDLTVELEYSMDPTTVQEIAYKRLGMDYPKPEQLVVVEAPVVQPPSDDAGKKAAVVTAPLPTSPEPSFAMPDVARAFTEDVEVIGLEENE